MVSNVKVSFGLVKDEVTPALKKQNKEYNESRDKIRQAKSQFDEYERAATRALKKMETGQTRYNQVVKGTGQLLKRNLITRQQALAIITAERNSQKKLTDSSRNNLSITRGLGAELSGIANSYLGAAAAAGLLAQQISTVTELERERQDITTASVENSANFALLNKGNIQQARQDVLGLGAQFGFGRDAEEQRQLLDIAQSLQSGLGEREKVTRAGVAGVLEARLVGITPEIAKELVLQGQTQGVDDPREFLRQALRAGQLSQRSAEEIGRNASALNFFEDTSFGFAAASVLTDAFDTESRTFVKAAGIALDNKIDRRRLGLDEDSTQLQVLQALSERGIDTTNEFKAAGAENIREIQALAKLVESLNKTDGTGLLTRQFEIENVRTVEGFIQREIRALFAEDAIQTTELAAKQRQAEFFNRRSFDEAASLRRAIGGDVLSRLDRLGVESVGGRRIADAEGNIRPFSAAAAIAGNPLIALGLFRDVLENGFASQRDIDLQQLEATKALNKPTTPQRNQQNALPPEVN